MNKWTFFARVIPDTKEWFKTLEKKIRNRFIPSITSQNTCNEDVIDLLALPICLGGLRISNPCKQLEVQFCASEAITAPLTNLILQQSHSYPAEVKAEEINVRNSIKTQRRSLKERETEELMTILPTSLQRSIKPAQEKGASS